MSDPQATNPISNISWIMFFRIWKRQPEFSSWDARVNFLGPHKQFNVPQWIQGDGEILEASRFPLSAPTRFAKHMPM
jgi:hypothetical protein